MEVEAKNPSESRVGQLFWRPTITSSHNKRRQEFLQRQHQRRKDVHARLRNVVQASNEDEASADSAKMEEEESVSAVSTEMTTEEEGDTILDNSATTRQHKKSSGRDRLSKRKEFVSHMSLPEWLIEVPEDLNGANSLEEGWIVVPRPEGTHSTLVAANSRTIIRDKHGLQLYSGTLDIPGGKLTRGINDFSSSMTLDEEAITTGSPARRRENASVLDGIFDKKSKTFFAIDCLSWNGLPLSDCGAVVRRSWLLSNLTSLGSGGTTLDSFSVISHGENAPALSITPHYECSYEGIVTAYSEHFCFNKDGLLFFQKAAPYGEGFINPCVLQYKDAGCSRWCPTADMENLTATLLCQGDGMLQCGDGVTVSNATVGAAQPNSLLKCMYLDAQYVSERELYVHDLKVVGPAGFRRIYADPSTKLVFNSNRRHSRPPDISEILQCAKR